MKSISKQKSLSPDKARYKEYKPSAVSEARFGQHALCTGKQQMYAELLNYTEEYQQKLRHFNRAQLLLAIYWFGVNDAALRNKTTCGLLKR